MPQTLTLKCLPALGPSNYLSRNGTWFAKVILQFQFWKALYVLKKYYFLGKYKKSAFEVLTQPTFLAAAYITTFGIYYLTNKGWLNKLVLLTRRCKIKKKSFNTAVTGTLQNTWNRHREHTDLERNRALKGSLKVLIDSCGVSTPNTQRCCHMSAQRGHSICAIKNIVYIYITLCILYIVFNMRTM